MRYLPKQKISTISTPLKVRKIKVSRYKFKEFVALFLNFSEIDSIGKLVYILLRYKIHLIKGQRANLLIGNNIILSKNFVIDIKKRTILIGSYAVIVPISIKQKK